MATPAVSSRVHDEPLAGATVVVIGGSSGIGLATARHARAEGADVVLTGRDKARLEQAGTQVRARGTASFDATDHAALQHFIDRLGTPIDHLVVSAGGQYYAPLADIDVAAARRAFDEHLWLMLDVARIAGQRIRPGGTLLFVGGIRGTAVGSSIATAGNAALAAVTATVALELAPVRVNLIAAGFVDTPLSARLLGDGLDSRRRELRATLPIRRVVEPDDVAALAVHLMTNTALTGGTYTVDGGQGLLPARG